MQSGTLVSLDTEAHCVKWSRQLVEHAGLSEKVKVLQSSPDETAAEALAREVPSPRIQLLFIDHAKDRYLADLVALEPYLAAGCVVVADNVLCFDGGASLKPYLEHVRDTSRYASSTLHEAPVEYSDGEPDGVELVWRALNESATREGAKAPDEPDTLEAAEEAEIDDAFL